MLWLAMVLLLNADTVRADEIPDCRVEHCSLSIATADGRLDCGRIRIKKDDKGKKWAMVRMPCDFIPKPSPLPTRSPSPTAAQPLCATNPATYCWAKGARLNASGSCFSNCSCIPRVLNACEN